MQAPTWFRFVDIDEETVDDRTLSVAFDVGMYVGQVFLKNNPNLAWFHELRRGDDINFGHPVITGVSNGLCFNPTHMLRVHAHRLSRSRDNETKRKTMRDIYNTWREKFQ